MTFTEILSSLEQGQYQPVYFLQGEESYMIDQVADHIEEHALNESEKGFNQTILYGRETNAATVLDHVKRYPMMSERQVVILKEAQQLKDLELLQAYISNPLASTIFVICYKYRTLDKRKQFYKAIQKNCVLLTANKLYENRIPAWIQDYLSGKGHSIHPKAAMLLTEYLGNDLSKIANELDKLILNVDAGKTISADDIERNIGISKDYNVFELQSALGQKDIGKANRILNYFIANPRSNPLVVILGTLYAYFSKIYIYHFSRQKSDKELPSIMQVHPFFLKDYKLAGTNYSLRKTEDILGWLKDYDLRSKGVNNTSASDGELLRELVYKILH